MGRTAWVFLWLLMGAAAVAQETQRTPDYVLGKEERLEMDVHIWGEVKSPGEYRVAYNTNLLELISKAGGPTQFANLKKVRLARLPIETDGVESEDERILVYDMEKYLKDKDQWEQVPVLQPGDVVVLLQNRWFQWRELVKVAHEVAVIASVYVWYLRAK
ncbi:MAG: SLBB domain protein [bacterium ADurb.Bin478]|nr:MAG: SLBB domain protein [bacterium ADurb.Bin478]